MQLCSITPEIVIQSARLPGEVHNDPVDRLLIATAYKEILDYGARNLSPSSILQNTL